MMLGNATFTGRSTSSGEDLSRDEDAARTVKVGRASLNVVVEGHGPPLLFVHGFPFDHSLWNPQREHFRETHRVIIPDLRGFGRSIVSNGRVTMSEFADDLIAILDELGIDEPATVCGLSMGGYIIWELLRKIPERINGLILCDTRAVADSQDGIAKRENLAEEVELHGTGDLARTMAHELLSLHTLTQRREIVDVVRSAILQAAPAGVGAALRGMAYRANSERSLPDIAQPALLIVGEEDRISRPAEMREIARRMPNARVVEVPRAGHLAPLEQPEFVNSEIEQFLASLERASGSRPRPKPSPRQTPDSELDLSEPRLGPDAQLALPDVAVEEDQQTPSSTPSADVAAADEQPAPAESPSPLDDPSDISPGTPSAAAPGSFRVNPPPIEELVVRVAAEDRQLWDQAAERHGLARDEWICQTLNMTAAIELSRPQRHAASAGTAHPE